MNEEIVALMHKDVLSTNFENLEVSLRRNVIIQLLSGCLQVGPKIFRRWDLSFSTVLHVFCSIEALKWFDKDFCIPFLSLQDYS